MTRLLISILFLLFAAPAIAQDSESADRGYFIGYVENQLSSPNRQIRINNIQGVLSSDATIGEITIADREGVWLRITNAQIVWTRSSLVFGNLNIDRLAAERIDVLRKPLPDEGAPAPEAGGFSVPELPLSVKLAELSVPLVTFGEGVFGLGSQIAVKGRLSLEGGSLDTALQINRLDGPGGQFDFSAKYANSDQVLNLDLKLSEPQDGVVANLLGIEGRPPIDLTLTGNGPVASLDLALTMDAAKQRVLAGTTQLRQASDGIRFVADVGGPIAEIIPARFRSFFGTDTRLKTDGTIKASGGLRLDSLTLNSAAIAVTAAIETAADGFPERLKFNAVVDDPTQDKTLLPISGDNTVSRATIDLSFGEAASDAWSGQIRVDDLATPAFGSKAVDIKLSGQAANLADATRRSVTFAVGGGVTGIAATDAGVAEALGDTISLDVSGTWRAGQPIDLLRAQIEANGFSLGLAGQIAESVFNGDIALKAADVAPFSQMAGRNVTGNLDLKANGSVAPFSGGFNLTLDGTGRNLTVGIPAADNLLNGETRMTGGVARGEQGLATRQFRISNDQVALTADGTYATGAADFGFELTLQDLANLSDRVSGRLAAQGRASGSGGLIALTFGANVESGTLVGKNLTKAMLAFDGSTQDGNLDGQFTGDAFLDGTRTQLTGGVGVTADERRITDLSLTAGGATIEGNVAQTVATGLLNGNLKLAAADVSTLAALAATEASGAANADVTLRSVDGSQNADATLAIRNLKVEAAAIGAADAQLTIADLFNVPMVEGSARATRIKAAGLDIDNVSGTAKREGDTTNFSAQAVLANGADAGLEGALTPVPGGYRLGLSTVDLTQGRLAARLVEPASLVVQGQNVRIDTLALDVGGGQIRASGDIADTLSLDVAIRALPLSIANAIKPDLALGGTIDGTARLGGTRARPDVNFDLKATKIAAAVLKQAGLSALDLNAKGTSDTERLKLDANVSSPEGLRASASGAVPLGQGDLDLNVNLSAFPLAILNSVAKGQELGGSAAGTARVTGTLAKPAASFDLRANGVRAAALNNAGAAPLDIGARGSFANNSVRLEAVNVAGPQGLTLNASGTVPLAGSGLSVSLNGQAPLALANRFLAERGTQISGTVTISGSATGSIGNPQLRGMVSTIGARVVDPEANIQLNDISVMASLDGTQVTIRSASGALSTGGAIRATGTISTNAAAGFPADIRVTLDNARYADGAMIAATVNGALALTGPLTRDPLLSGNVNILKAEITVPESFTAGSSQIDVKHRNASPGVMATLKRAKANDGTPVPNGRPSVVRLDVTVTANNQVFIRGRGLDAEIGGSVRVTGPATAVQPVGAFKLVRGRLSILGQRITFDEGEVTLVGDLDPYLNFVARTDGEDITVFVNVTGRVSDLEIGFTSQPNLPQDEVLARLIFKRGIDELSPIQIAQLAAAAAELAGGSNTSLLGSLRKATGLDDLDVVTDSEGNAAVKAGRYIRDNIYLGVEAGAGGTTRGTINLDITRELKAKGGVGSDGDSSVGVFYEKDY